MILVQEKDRQILIFEIKVSGLALMFCIDSVINRRSELILSWYLSNDLRLRLSLKSIIYIQKAHLGQDKV